MKSMKIYDSQVTTMSEKGIGQILLY